MSILSNLQIFMGNDLRFQNFAVLSKKDLTIYMQRVAGWVARKENGVTKTPIFTRYTRPAYSPQKERRLNLLLDKASLTCTGKKINKFSVNKLCFSYGYARLFYGNGDLGGATC